MAKAKKAAETSDISDRIEALETELQELKALVAKDIAAIHRSLKAYKESNDSTVGEIRQVTESLAKGRRR